MMNWIYKWHKPRVDPGAKQLSETIASIFLHGVLNGQNGAKSKAAEESALEQMSAAE